MTKRRRRATTRDECAYCGRAAETEDDIPPRGMFGGRRSTITVPSCLECNRGASDDDEYFRLSVCFHEDVANEPAAAPAVAKAQRSLQRIRATGLYVDFVSRTKVIPEPTASGLYRLRTTINVDYERLDRVVSRMVRGLFYRHTGRRLPASRRVLVRSKQEFRGRTNKPWVLAAARAALELLREPARGAGDGSVFRYHARFRGLDPDQSEWLLVFYEKFFFLAATIEDRRRAGGEGGAA